MWMTFENAFFWHNGQLFLNISQWQWNLIRLSHLMWHITACFKCPCVNRSKKNFPKQWLIKFNHLKLYLVMSVSCYKFRCPSSECIHINCKNAYLWALFSFQLLSVIYCMSCLILLLQWIVVCIKASSDQIFIRYSPAASIHPHTVNPAWLVTARVEINILIIFQYENVKQLKPHYYPRHRYSGMSQGPK